MPRTSMRLLMLALIALTPLARPAAAREEGKIDVLLIDGQNNHNWQAATPILEEILNGTGRFSVTVATSPPKGADPAAWEKFRPDFSKYQAVISNYNGDPWPEPVRKGLEEFVANGGGLVVVHAANNAFADWTEWNKMIGLGWRDSAYGDRITLDDQGNQVRTAKGEGPASGHGPQHEYVITTRDPEHPITRGMPREWLHTTDELYHGQRGPARGMRVLASAFSAKDKGGTDANEPIAWVIPYGKGRVFTCVLGHNMGDEKVALECVGFRTLLRRGTEWAATEKATLAIPEDFPSASKAQTESNGAGNGR